MIMSNHATTQPPSFAHDLAEAVLQAVHQVLPEAGPERRRLVETLAQDSRIRTLAEQASAVETEPRVQSLRNQVERLRRQKDELLKDTLELKDQKNLMEEAARNSLYLLLSWARPIAGSQEVETLDEIKKLLISESDWQAVEERIRTLKRLSPAEASATARTRGGVQDEGAVTGPHVETLRHQLGRLLSQFHVDLGAQYLEEWNRLRERLHQCDSIDALIEAIRDTLALAERFSGALNRERAQLAKFFSDIGQDLLEMEVLLSSAVNLTRENYQASQDFNTLLDGKMEEISASVNLSRTLEELKSALEAKMSAIKRFLKEKQKEDETRFRKADENSEVLQSSLQRMKQEVTQMEERTRRLEKQALQDALTGVYNRRAFDLRIQEEMYRYQRYGQHFSLLVIDLDHFKKVNDSFGHTTGDQCLQEVTRRMKLALRRSDCLARYGGEEFAVILPGTDGGKALAVAEKLRKIVEKTRFLYKGKQIPLTVSIGVTQVGGSDKTSTDVFERADRALYRAKAQGRNRVEAILA
jgi:diguanylate cyclase (GGDEF)-like protein